MMMVNGIKLYLTAICLLFLLQARSTAATVDSDYGLAQITTKKVEGRVFTDLMSAGRMVFGFGKIEKAGTFVANQGSLVFLPGSFFFRFQESGISSAYQMIYPVIRDLSDSRVYLVPLVEFGTALSSNKFEFRASEDESFHLRRLPSYKAALANAELALRRTDKKASTPGHAISIPTQKTEKSLPKSLMISGDSQKYNYARLRPLPKSSAESEAKLVGHSYEIPAMPKGESDNRIRGIPVFEDGKMDYSPLEKEEREQDEEGKGSSPGFKPTLRMGKDNDSIVPPPIDYKLPEGIYRREIENKLKEHKQSKEK